MNNDFKIVCKKDKCVWLVECGGGKAICSRYKCPYMRKQRLHDLPKIKWLGITDKK